MNIESTGNLGASVISLNKKGNGSDKIANNKGLEKGSLVQHKMIS